MNATIDKLYGIKRGQRVTYHIGAYLAASGGGRPPEATVAWNLYTDGRVVLVQRRVGRTDRFEYIAQGI